MAVGIYAIQSMSSGEEVNAWLESYDPEAAEGRGWAHFTPDPSRAMRFENVKQAREEWMRVPASRPVRDDGKPNRPLTSFTIELKELP